MRFRLRTLLIFLAIGPIFAGMMYRKYVLAMPPRTIQSEAEFNSVIHAASGAVIHLDVDWSIPAVVNRQHVEKLRKRLALDPRYRAVVWRRTDCSGEDTPVWYALDEWLATQDLDRYALKQGYGALVWIRDGRAVASLMDSSSESSDKLFARSLDAFGKR